MRRLRRALGLIVVALVVGIGLAISLGERGGDGRAIAPVDACGPGPGHETCDDERDEGPPAWLLVPVAFGAFLVVVGLPVLLVSMVAAKLLARRQSPT